MGVKFHVLGKATVVEKKPWEKFLIPNAKSDRLIYFNAITKAVYESGFVGKQSSTFQAYLDGQRRFRYGLVVSGRDDSWKRYQDFPSDVKVEDISKSQRAVEHFNGTIKSLNDIRDHLSARKKELYDDRMNQRPWASDELKFINETLLL